MSHYAVSFKLILRYTSLFISIDTIFFYLLDFTLWNYSVLIVRILVNYNEISLKNYNVGDVGVIKKYVSVWIYVAMSVVSRHEWTLQKSDDAVTCDLYSANCCSKCVLSNHYWFSFNLLDRIIALKHLFSIKLNDEQYIFPSIFKYFTNEKLNKQ